jgi:hypothetical protein
MAHKVQPGSARSQQPSNVAQRVQPRRVWPIWIGLALLGLVVVMMLVVSRTRLAPSATVSPSSGASFVFDQTTVDFGKVPFNKTVEHSFVYRNIGASPVTIVEKPKVEIVEGC